VVDVIVLGSGTPNPDPDRAGAAVAVADGPPWVMIDCGRGATQRALAAGLDLAAVAAVLLTHHHSDHVSDLATFAIARWVAGAEGALVVVAPEGPSAEFARCCLDGFSDGAFHGQTSPGASERPTIAVDAFASAADPGAEPGVVLDASGWLAWAAPVDHHPVLPAVGYAIERHGVRVVVSGDTVVCDGVRSLAAGAQVLVHEALLTAAVDPELLTWNASARSVGELAATTAPDTLVLTHLIPAPTSSDDEEAYIAEVRSGGFTGEVVIAHDLLRLSIGDRSTDRPIDQGAATVSRARSSATS
jgi:ribonuclease Z